MPRARSPAEKIRIIEHIPPLPGGNGVIARLKLRRRRGVGLRTRRGQRVDLLAKRAHGLRRFRVRFPAQIVQAVQPVLEAHICRQRAECLFARHCVGAVRALFERVGKAAVRLGEAQQRVEHAAAALDKARSVAGSMPSAHSAMMTCAALGAFAVVAEAAVFHLAGRERAERQLDRLAHGALDRCSRRLIRYGENVVLF